MTRQPVVKGQFYESENNALKNQIEDCFCSKFGPGKLSEKRTNNNIKAVIVPHAGYFFSGPCAAWAYQEIAESRNSGTFMIIGPNHNSFGTAFSGDEWETPFGVVQPQKELIAKLSKATSIKISEPEHRLEHSMEVQIPFLQYIFRDTPDKLRIIPLIVGYHLNYKKIGKQIYSVLTAEKKDIIIIISSDFTHYGPNYDYVPFTDNILDRLSKLDMKAVELITKLDISGFEDYLKTTGITICGFMPILILLSIMQNYSIKPMVKLLKYYKSAEVVKDYNNSVSYVSMVFY
jgi:AmmeMemoRadiSam system protein B